MGWINYRLKYGTGVYSAFSNEVKSWRRSYNLQEPESYGIIDGKRVISIWTSGSWDRDAKMYSGERRKVLKHSGIIPGLPPRFANSKFECCIRDDQGKFICNKLLFEQDYFYYGEILQYDMKYCAFCKQHWEI